MHIYNGSFKLYNFLPSITKKGLFALQNDQNKNHNHNHPNNMLVLLENKIRVNVMNKMRNIFHKKMTKTKNI